MFLPVLMMTMGLRDSSHFGIVLFISIFFNDRLTGS